MNRRSSLATVFTAFVFVVGLEMMRFQFSSLGWYQRDTVGIATLDLIPLAVAPFLAGAVVPITSRFIGRKAALVFGAVVLVAARLVNQIVVSPAVDHWASAAGVAAFVGLLAVIPALGRSALVGGVLVGVALDSAIKATGATLDLPYRPGGVPLMVTAIIGAAILYLASSLEATEGSGPTWAGGVTLLGLGPFLFIQYLVLQSPGWTAQLTGSSSAVAALRIVVLDVVAVWVAMRAGRSRLVVAAAAVAVAASVLVATGPSLVFSVVAGVGLVATGPLWAGLVPSSEGRSLLPSSVYVVAGTLLFLMLGFAYYLPLDLDLGFTQDQARVGSAVAVAVFGLGAALRSPPSEPAVAVGAPQLAAVTLLLPVVALLGVSTLEDVPTEGPLRVMAYNVHQSFGTAGDLDVEAVADVIVDSGATIVGLQEVARGGLLNAGTDLVALLGERLGWESVAFFGTTDPVWGNAILSRYPIGEAERRLLPTVGTLYRRGWLAATVEIPGGDVLVASIHLQHINDPDAHDDDPEADLYPVHTVQLAEVIDQWAGRRPAVLLGDFNARPGWRQIDELLESGWVDAWDEAGDGPGYTSNAADPRYRIDYVFHTPGMTAVGAEVIESQASDHFAVVADLELP